MSECSTYVVNYVCIYKRVQMKTGLKIKITGTWSAAKLPSGRLCYPQQYSSVPPSPSSPCALLTRGKFGTHFENVIISFFTFSKGVILKLRKLNLLQYKSVYQIHLKHLSVQNTGTSRLLFCGMSCWVLALIIITRLSTCALLLEFQHEDWLSTVHREVTHVYQRT